MSSYHELFKSEPMNPDNLVGSPCFNCICPCEESAFLHEMHSIIVTECLRHTPPELKWLIRMGTDYQPDDVKLVKWLRRETAVYRDTTDFYRDVIRKQRKYIADLERRVEALTLVEAYRRTRL